MLPKMYTFVVFIFLKLILTLLLLHSQAQAQLELMESQNSNRYNSSEGSKSDFVAKLKYCSYLKRGNWPGLAYSPFLVGFLGLLIIADN